MSCRFHYTQESISSLELRHTDSGLSRIKVNSKFNAYQIDVLDRLRELQTRRRASVYPRKHFEYSKEHQIVLPTNPALRALPKERVTKIVTRLYSSDKDSDPSLLVRGCHYCRREQSKHSSVTHLSDSTEERCPHCTRELVKSKQISRSQEYISDMVERLSTAKISESDFDSGRLIRFPSVRNLKEDGFDGATNFGSAASMLDEDSIRPFSLSVTISPKSNKHQEGSTQCRDIPGESMKCPDRFKTPQRVTDEIPNHMLPKRIVPKRKNMNAAKVYRRKINQGRIIFPVLQGFKTTIHTPKDLHDKQPTVDDHDGKASGTTQQVPTRTATHEDMVQIMKNRQNVLRSAYSADNIPRVFISQKEKYSTMTSNVETKQAPSEEPDSQTDDDLSNNKSVVKKSVHTPVGSSTKSEKFGQRIKSNSVTNAERPALDVKKDDSFQTSKAVESPKSLLRIPGKHTNKHVTYADNKGAAQELGGHKRQNKMDDEDQLQNTEISESIIQGKRDTHSRYSNRTRLTV